MRGLSDRGEGVHVKIIDSAGTISDFGVNFVQKFGDFDNLGRGGQIGAPSEFMQRGARQDGQTMAALFW